MTSVISETTPSGSCGNGRDFYDDGYGEEEQVLNNRIVFSPDKFFGRKKELRLLKNIYHERACHAEICTNSPKTTNSTPVVIIDGFSGTGKSTLVRRFLLELNRDASTEKSTIKVPFAMQGKFEELKNSSPYSAILEAMSSFLHSILIQSKDGNGEDLQQIRNAVIESMGSEKSSLVPLFPCLQEILGEDEDKGDSQIIEKVSFVSCASETSSGDSWNRIRYLFRLFFRAICSENRPVIMFLDDLQWADESSLEIMSSLIQDESLRHFMFVGAMRGNEVDKNKGALSSFLRDVDVPSGNCVHIDLLNLCIDEVGEFVADTLRLSPEESRPLTEVVYGKTRGNIFFSMQTLEELQRRNVLYFSVITFRWEWNLEGVEFQNALSSTIVEAVASKIQSMPERLQRALIIASYTRSFIDVVTLKALLNADDVELELKELVGLLDIAVLEGLLVNTVGSNFYKFGHDKIKQAAYWMVPSGKERDHLRITIGNVLVELAAGPEGKDWMLFVAADHLNSCTGHGQANSFLSELNLSCGKKASKLAAFVPASLYLRLALKYLKKLDKDPWKSHYDLSLRVYREIANIELSLGNFASGYELGQQLIDNSATLEDKLPTYLALIVAKGRQHRHAESLELCREALLRLDAFPKHFRVARMVRDFRIVQRLLRRHSDEEILSLPLCQDKKKATIMDFLTEYSLRSYHCGNLLEFIYSMVRKIRISFKYGLARGSAHALATYGIILQGPGNDPEGALRMARLARELMNKMEHLSRSTNALTLLAISSIIEPWTFPRERILESLQRAHHIGMASGNIEIGFQSWASGNLFAQVCGYPLSAIDKAGSDLMQQLRRYHVDSVAVQLEECQLSVACLIGKRNIDWDALEPRHLSDEKSELYRNVFGYLSRLEIGVYFGNYDFAVRMSNLIQPYAKSDGAYSSICREPFYSCLAYAGLAQISGRRSHLSKAVKFAKRLKHLCNTRGMNVHHKCLLMDAQLLSFRTNNGSKLITAYDTAIHAAMQSGYIQDSALSCEIAGATMLDFGLESRAYKYLNEARDMWREYGAHAKVDHLLSKYGRKLDTAEGMTTYETVPDQFYASVDFSSGSQRRSIDLSLLSGTAMRTDIMRSTEQNQRDWDDSRNKQEDVSILSDPSSAGGATLATPLPVRWARQ